MKKDFIKIIRNTIYGVIGLVSALSVILAIIESLIKKALKKMSFRTKLGLTIFAICLVLANIQLVKHEIEIVTKTKIETQIKEVEVEVPKVCEWSFQDCAIYNVARKEGLTFEQAKMAIAISQHETGLYKSPLCKNYYNYGGLYYNGHFLHYESEEDGITAYIRTLKKGYFDKGKTTFELIQKNWCPIGAKNDPNNTNVNWLPKVHEYYNNL